MLRTPFRINTIYPDAIREGFAGEMKVDDGPSRETVCGENHIGNVLSKFSGIFLEFFYIVSKVFLKLC